MIKDITRRAGLWSSSIAVVIVLLVLLIPLGLQNFLLYHVLVECFSVVIAECVFILAWNSRRNSDNDFLLFLGVAYLSIGVVDILHALSYKGMNIFPDATANLPTQLWIAARYMEGAALVFAPWFFSRKSNGTVLVSGSLGILALVLLSIFLWDIFPDCFLEPGGLTPFKKYSEYIICISLLFALYGFYLKRSNFSSRTFSLMIGSIVLTITAELLFTFYLSVYGLSNFVGHLLKVLSFYLIYEAVVAAGIREPFDLLYRQLQYEKEELTRTNEELDDFTRIVSHDLKSPLIAIKGFAGLMQKKHNQNDNTMDAKYLGMIQDSCQWMETLVSRLIEIARAGKPLGSIERLDMGEEVSIILTLLQTQLAEKKGKIAVSEELYDVLGDRTRIRQVFQNLIVNALENGAGVDGLQIEIESKLSGDQVEYRVSDNGKGIPEVARESVFQPYTTLESEGEGSGLGLAICNKIIQAHGGRIWVESNDADQGCAFCFTLPHAIGVNR